MNKIKLIHKAKEILSLHNSEFTPIGLNKEQAFYAMGLAHIDWMSAADHLREVFKGQWKNGLLPHIIFGEKSHCDNKLIQDFWETQDCINAPADVYTTSIVQVPSYGFVLLKMYELAEDKALALSFLREMYPKILSFHKYLYTYRDSKEEGLIAVIHPAESGTEGSPIWDSVLDKMPEGIKSETQHMIGEERQHDYSRYLQLISLFKENDFDDLKIEKSCPIRVQDPYFNAILSWSNEAMIEIGRLLKEDVTDFVLWNELTVFSLNEKLWDEEQGIYNAYDMVNERFIPGDTLSGMLAIMADVPNIDQAENILRNIKDEYFSGTKDNPMFLCPTYDVTAQNIRFSKKYRGAISISQNWLLYQGLKRFEMNAVAQRVKENSLDLIDKYGFSNDFNPLKNVLIGTDSTKDTYKSVTCAAVCLDFLLEED